jgi:hypothetical protein
MNEARDVVQETERGLRIVVPFRARVARVAVPLLWDAAGLLGAALTTWGVYLNWGKGWAYIVAGIQPLAVYVVYSIRWARAQRRG